MVETVFEMEEAPNFPGVPEEVRRQWQSDYEKEFKLAQIENPQIDGLSLRMQARRRASRVFRVGEVKNFDEAVKLPDWQKIKQEVAFVKDAKGNFTDNRMLRVITMDGQKFEFPIPKDANPPTFGVTA
jgi:hypothetical protein